MSSETAVHRLWESDERFREFAKSVLGAAGPQDAWEMLYAPGGVSKMSTDPSDIHVPGPLRPLRPQRAMVARPVVKPTPRLVAKSLAGVAPPTAAWRMGVIGGTTALAAGAAAAQGTKKIGVRLRGYKKTPGDTSRPVAPQEEAAKSWDGLAEFSVVKADDDKRQVFGWASIIERDGEPVLDRQGDVISEAEMEKSAYKYVLESRKGGHQHQRDELTGGPKHVSDLIESLALTKEKKERMGLPANSPTGWWVGFHVKDDETWRKVKNGEVTAFSIHGKGRRQSM